MHWPGHVRTVSAQILRAGLAYLLHNVPQLLLDLLLSTLESLPQIIADAAPLQQDLECLLRVPDLHDAVDVFGCAAQERSFQDAIRCLRLLLVQQRQVDVALDVRREPRLERRGGGGLALAVQVREDCERADQDEQVGDGDQQHEPVDGVEGPHFGGGLRCRLSLIACAAGMVYFFCGRREESCAGRREGEERSDCEKRLRGESEE